MGEQVQTFNLPDVGEGLTEAEVVSWKVKVGDQVSINDVLVEIETAKSLVELPSPFAGTVSALLVAEGQTVDVGTPIIAIGGGAGVLLSQPELDIAPELMVPESGKLTVPHTASASSTDPTAPTGGAVEAAPPGPLVGTGPKADAVHRRARRGADPAIPTPAATAAPEVPARVGALPPARPLATPPVRKAAKDWGLDLALVPATGKSGEVTRKDLVDYRDRTTASSEPVGAWTGEVLRIPVKGVRKATAEAMVRSAFSAPHVSIFIDVDASRTMEFVKRLKTSRDFEGVKVSPLLIVAKAVIWAAGRNPSVNAAWTDQEILLKGFVNLGIAAATPRGLVVPNIKDAQRLSLKELAVALSSLAETARAGKTQPAQMQDGTITITNIGALGLDTGTPIINPGEVGIVAFGTVKQKPWVVDGQVVPRWITTLGGSFDHRVVDGDVAARFLGDVAAILEEPALLLD